jgi:hypothetical protein
VSSKTLGVHLLSKRYRHDSFIFIDIIDPFVYILLHAACSAQFVNSDGTDHAPGA